MEESKPKPLPYDALRSVLKYTSLRKRDEIHRRIPELRKTNALIPYQFESVFLFSNLCTQIDKLVWRFQEVRNKQSPTYDIIPNKCTCHIQRYSMRYHANLLHLDKRPDEAFEELLNTFITDGTTIKILVVEGFPQSLLRQNPENFQLKVSSISLKNEEGFEKMLMLIDEKSLTEIEFHLINDKVEPFLNVPMIKNCPKLIITNHYNNIFPWSKLHLLSNKFLEYCHDHRFPINDLQALVAEWKRRPIGTIFLIATRKKDGIIDLMNRLKEHHGAKSSKLPASLNNSSNVTCITMKMDNGNDTELVVFFGPKKDGEWPMQMEVMKAGTTILD